jgi:hypothetical protein
MFQRLRSRSPTRPIGVGDKHVAQNVGLLRFLAFPGPGSLSPDLATVVVLVPLSAPAASDRTLYWSVALHLTAVVHDRGLMYVIGGGMDVELSSR